LNANSSPKFGFDFKNVAKEETLKVDVQTPVVNETEEEHNTSLSESQVEPSNADSIYFQPVVPLPPKVDIKTGEEEETVLYVSRARLFRFCDNEWKERGVGDLKILESPESQRIRLLMRRDTILKVCLNQYITADLKLDLKDDKKSITWSAIDYSEETPNPQIFLLRLKNLENAELFLNAFRSAQSRLCVNKTTDNSCTSVEKQNTLNCNENLKDTKTQESTNSVPKCDSKSCDDDIEIVYMKAPESEEILRKVKELQLPLNFYDYETMEPCKGCRGCRDDDYYFKTDSKPQVKDNSNPDDSNSNSKHSIRFVFKFNVFNEILYYPLGLFRSAIAATNVSQSEWKTNSSPKSWMTSTPAPLFSSEHNTSTGDDGI